MSQTSKLYKRIAQIPTPLRQSQEVKEPIKRGWELPSAPKYDESRPKVSHLRLGLVEWAIWNINADQINEGTLHL